RAAQGPGALPRLLVLPPQPHRRGQPLSVRRLDDDDRDWARRLIAETWGVPVVSPGGVYDDPAALDGLVAEDDAGRRVGLLTHRIAEGRCEIVALVVLEEGRGHGRAWLEAARAGARGGGGQ